ncbi:MAG: AraC family transcriptional regulator [Mycobacterium kyogaense]|uniref:AraC family transcriptional regulator n=1 Tax=Mycobacterium kyogaense TaxID=2212479 RepID=UPI002FF86329
MDALAGLLDGIRARGAFVLRMRLDPPWSMRVCDEAPLTVICQTHGAAVIVPVDGQPIELAAGQLALTRGTEPYVFADDAGTPPMIVIHPGQRCTTVSGDDLRFEMALGVRTWGNSSTGSCRSVIGAYEGYSTVGARLLDALPAVAVMPADASLVALLSEEAGRDGPGQESYLDRLLDLLLITAIRSWFDTDGAAPTWWRAEHDGLIGPALKLMYRNPSHPWTVELLAAAVGCSRAAFARRFTDLVGEPPIAFLTGWRLALAADLLRSGATVAAVARQVGYGSPFALSTAFKRTYGISPHAHRSATA